MVIYTFDRAAGQAVNPFGSHGLVRVPIARLNEAAQLGCFYLQPGGVLGYHEASGPQLFMVISGEGWVRGAEPEHTPISAGQAAFWTTGEWHESGSETGMTVMILEAADLDSARYLKPVVG